MQKVDHTGETRIMLNGQRATIIVCRSCKDIDVQFEDGTILEHRSYGNFIKGKIKNPNLIASQRIGEERKMTNGQIAKIVRYDSCSDVDLLFEDGTLVKSVFYASFKAGNVKNPNCIHKKDLIGMRKLMKNGQYATLTEYFSSDNITVVFEDGTKVTEKGLGAFKHGYIHNPNFNIKTWRIGEERVMRNGQKAKIVVYRTAKDIDIKFEDGMVVRNKAYSAFLEGTIANPKLYGKYKGFDLILSFDDTEYWAWKKDNKEYIYSMREIDMLTQKAM